MNKYYIKKQTKMSKDKKADSIAEANKQNILSIKREERSSRFVVDLKKRAGEEQKENKKRNKIAGGNFFERLAEFNFKEFFEKGKSFKEDFRDFFNSCRQNKRNIIKGAEQLAIAGRMPPETKESLVAGSKLALDWFDIYSARIEQLALFSFGKFLIIAFFRAGKWFYRFCYGLGWLVLFLVRFLGLVLYEFIGLACSVGSKFYLAVKFVSQFLFVNFRDFAGKIFAIVRKFIFLLSKELKIGWNGLLVKAGSMAESIKREKVAISQRLENSYKERKTEMLIKVKLTWQRSVLGFALVLLVLVLPFKIFAYYKSFDLEKLRGRILGASEAAIGSLKEASESAINLDFNKASYNFARAGDDFLKAQDQLAEINDLIFALARVTPNEEIKLASQSQQILAAGQIASILGSNLSLALESLFNNKNKDILEIINNFTDYGGKALIKTGALRSKLAEINTGALPKEYREKFLLLKEKTEVLEKRLAEFIGLMDKLRTFLGTNRDKRYLLVFQNNAEMRASGGFIGNFALVDLAGGKIKNIEAPGGGSYDTEGGLRELVAAPEPLRLVNPLWHFWDANWWPDWPTSAKKLMWFYERSDGSTVDGVISFTPTVLEKLLSITGPVDMTKDYGVTLTAENFWLTTQTIVEEKPKAGEANKPKKIIGDLMDKIIADLPAKLDKDKLVKILSLAEESLSEKHILFYFVDEGLQQEIAKRGWDGKMKQTNRDYLSVVNTNIAGGKSDKRIKEVINQVTEIMPNGSIINTVKIERTHEGIKREPFSGVRNVDWMRIYVPAGSELLETQGFRQPDEIYFAKPEENWKKDPLVYREETTAKIHEASGTKIYDESGKTVFANWSMVDPGESTTIYLKYKLPFVLKEEEREDNFINKIKELLNPTQKELFPYTLLAQKQSGSMGSEINTSLKLPDNFKIVWKYPAGLSLVSDGWYVSDKLNTDKYWAVLLEKED